MPPPQQVCDICIRIFVLCQAFLFNTVLCQTAVACLAWLITATCFEFIDSLCSQVQPLIMRLLYPFLDALMFSWACQTISSSPLYSQSRSTWRSSVLAAWSTCCFFQCSEVLQFLGTWSSTRQTFSTRFSTQTAMSCYDIVAQTYLMPLCQLDPWVCAEGDLAIFLIEWYLKATG